MHHRLPVVVRARASPIAARKNRVDSGGSSF